METQESNPPESQPSASPPAADLPETLQGCYLKIRETIQTDLDDQELVSILKKGVKRLKDWDKWSEHARLAYSHLLVAQLLHEKAANIRIAHALEFNDECRAEYEQLLKTIRQRDGR